MVRKKMECPSTCRPTIAPDTRAARSLMSTLVNYATNVGRQMLNAFGTSA
jgi:hypothetical protein